MNHDDWDFRKIADQKWGDVKIVVSWSRIPGRKKWYGIGVDPGRNFSVATLDGREAWLFRGILTNVDKTKKYLYAEEAFDIMAKGLNYYGQGSAVVEGAAFKSTYGQADLAHVRMGFYLGLRAAGHNVSIHPPSTIRANALGKGSLGGLEVWPELNHNDGDSLATALYAAGLRKGDLKGSHLK